MRRMTFMSISISLIESIIVMFLMIMAGYLLAKKNILQIKDADVLSKLVLYVACPASIIASFQIKLTNENMIGFLISLVCGALFHGLFIFLAWLIGKKMQLSAIEKASMIYPNAGNLILPLVTMVLGKDMVIYCSGAMIANTVLVWTHGRQLITGSQNGSWKKILGNINIIAIGAGTVLFLCNLQLPSILNTAVNSMSAILAPLSMFVVGIILSTADLKEVFLNKRAYMVCLFRLILFPLAAMVLFILTGLTKAAPNAGTVVMISMLAASAPSASTVAQFASLYHNDAQQASIINVMSVLLCILTIPFMNMIYIALTGI